MSPRVSVILPTYNRELLLGEALGSIEAQSFRDWEVIVVDDASATAVHCGSGPQTLERVRVLRHDLSRGGAAAKNTGVVAARGDYLAFLDDDDLYHPEYLARAVEVLDGDDDIDVLFMGVGWFGSFAAQSAATHNDSLARILSSGTRTSPGSNLFTWSGHDLLSALLRSVPMPFQRPVVRRQALERIGPYRADCLLWDCEWALRASMAARCALLNEPLYLQRAEGQGLFSRHDRQREHIESASEMVLGLYRDLSAEVSHDVRALLRGAAGRNAEHLAFYLSGRGDLPGALRACWRAQMIAPSLARLKMPISAMVRSVRWMGRRP